MTPRWLVFVVEFRAGTLDFGHHHGGPAQEGVDEFVEGVADGRNPVFHGEWACVDDQALNHSIALEATQSGGERFLPNRGDRPAQIVESHRFAAQLVEHLQRPLVEHLVEQFAVRGIDIKQGRIVRLGVRVELSRVELSGDGGGVVHNT